MSLHPEPIDPVPEPTVRVAHAAFPKGNPYLRLRDEMGPLFQDDDFQTCTPMRASPGSRPGAWPG
jgi:transposase